MGVPKSPSPAALFVAVLFKPEISVEQIHTVVAKNFGEILLQSSVYLFNHSDYYAEEMGGNLQKVFLLLNRLIDPCTLAEWKLRAQEVEAWRITWQPPQLSASFHGRDLFAPVAARLARGEPPPGEPIAPGALVGHDWPDDLAAIVYIDSFGNAMTGLRAARLNEANHLVVRGERLERVRTFSAVARGAAFWYENANGLAEIAVNQERADRQLGLTVGERVEIE